MLRAYIAPFETNGVIRYSVFLDDLAGMHENAIDVESLADAVTWALNRTDFVVARGSLGPYCWYGRGRKPSDIELPPARGVDHTD